MQRMGLVIGIKPSKIAEYKALHAEPWDGVLAQLRKSNIRNFSIFLREPENLLFAYWEYVGDDFQADMKKMQDDPETQRWWSFTDPCQEPLASRKHGEHWALMEQVFLME